MRRIYRKIAGVSLIELMVALSIVAILALVTAEYQRQKQLQGMNQTRATQASSVIREFLDLRKKVIACLTGPDLNIDPLNQQNPDDPNNINNYSVVSTNKSGASFTETVSNECVDPPAGLAGINWATLAANELDQMRACTLLNNCPSGQVPRIRVQRTGGVISNETFPPGSGEGTDGNPFGAVLCMRANGTFTTGQPTDYRDIHFDLYVLFRTSNNSVKLVRQQANIPRPKNFIPGVSIRVCP